MWLALAFAIARGICAGGEPVAAPALWQLPAFDGELSGDFLMPQSGGGSGLMFHWHIVAESPADAPGARRARVEVTGHGARVVARAELDLASGVTHWKIESAEADLGEVFPVMAALWWANSSFASAGVTGKLVVSGEGSVDAAGKWVASLAADVRDATLRDGAGGWMAEGVSAHVEFPGLPSLETGAAQAQPVTVRRFTHKATQLAIDDARTSVSMDGGGAGGALRIHIGGVEARAVDGRIGVDGFDFVPSAPAVATIVHASNVESGYLTHLLPGAVSEVRGRFSGAVALTWNPADGLRAGNGQLSLQRADGTMLRLAPTPGIFTANMDRRLYFLPQSFGFLRKWISLKNPAYDTLKEIEEGRQPIIVDNITIKFTPDGDDAGRSASVAIEARPTNPQSSIRRLRINVNVNGPLTQVIEMFSRGSVQISF